MNSDSIILSLIFISHLFLNCWAVLAFMSTSYFLYNIFFLVSLLWSVHETRSSGPVFVALMINLMAIVMDAILIGIFWYDGKHYTFVLSALATFVNMIYRLLTSLILFQIMQKRRQMETNCDTFQSASKDVIQYLKYRPQFSSGNGQPQTTSNTVITTQTTTQRSSSNIHLP